MPQNLENTFKFAFIFPLPKEIFIITQSQDPNRFGIKPTLGEMRQKAKSEMQQRTNGAASGTNEGETQISL